MRRRRRRLRKRRHFFPPWSGYPRDQQQQKQLMVDMIITQVASLLEAAWVDLTLLIIIFISRELVGA